MLSKRRYKKYILYDSIYVKFRNRSKLSMVLGARITLTGIVTRNEHKGGFSVLITFSFLMWLLASRSIYFVRIYQAVHLQFGHLSLNLL